MGASGSVQTNVENADPKCKPQQSQLQTPSDILQFKDCSEGEATNKENNTMMYGEEQWLKQIQDLGKVVQNLANENAKLLNSNKEWKQKCEELEENMKERKISGSVSETSDNLQIINCLNEEAVKNMTLIEDLRQQISTMAQNSASEVKKYHENLNFMKMKVKEYEQIVAKLETDAATQNTAMHTLQNSVHSASDENKILDRNLMDMKEAFCKLKEELNESLNVNISLSKQIDVEKNSKENILIENRKLIDELKQVKHQLRTNTPQRTSENSDADASEIDFSAETEAAVAEVNANKSEENKTLSPRAAAELAVFKKQMNVKREARHKALSAISGEMERLRRELNSEREAKRSILKELEDLKNVSSAHHIFDEVNDLKKLLSSEREAKDKVYKEMVQNQKQGNEEIEDILKELEREKEKNINILMENKYLKEQLIESDQSLQLRLEENNQLQNKLESDKEKYQQQVAALKDVVAISKQMLTVRENQVTHLKQTLRDIEISVFQKHGGSLTADLKAEYETQIENIKSLKALYEERTQVMNAEKEKLINEQKELQQIIESEKGRIEDLELKLQEKNMLISERNTTVSSLQDQLSDALDQSRKLSQELTMINKMFTQILGSNDVDLDRLTKLLQENHDLITEITTKGESSETTASLPKLLLDLVCDVEEAGNKEREGKDLENKEPTELQCENLEGTAGMTQSGNENDEVKMMETVVSVNGTGATLAIQDISSYLPKVWRVLLELISHHVPSTADESTEEPNISCYKSIDTPYGPKNVISVSQTFLRLRDLILQKKSLQKEVTRLKQLNVHLETKLSDQERRLSLVSTEVRKTWNVVDHMRIQHQQLHTHEKVLRYELQQKRKLLTELKEELEYCKEKWDDARQKNSQSEIEWQKLRTEFALRKSKPNSNSGENGFSEEKEGDVTDSDKGKIPEQSSYRNPDDITELESIETANNSSSLPDLVSVTTDVSSSLSQSDVLPEMNVLSSSNVNEETLTNLQSIVQKALTFESINNNSSFAEDCPTVSLITLLKQQLSCFSKNIEIITAGDDSNDHFKALQSIFALPAIQIPEYLNPINSERSLRISSNKDVTNETFMKGTPYLEEDVGISNTEKNYATDEILPSYCVEEMTSSVNFDKEDVDICATLESCSEIPEHTEMLLTTGPPEHSTPLTTECVQQENRGARIQRLERQCRELFDKVTQGKTTGTDCAEEKQAMSTEDSRGSTKSFNDMLDARAARLKRLEEQSQQLFKKVKRTTHRSEALSNRLEELHEQYGSEDAPTSNNESSVASESSSNNIAIPAPLPNYVPSSEIEVDNAVDVACPSLPSTSNAVSTPPLEKMLGASAAELKRLEEQSQQQFKKVTQTTHQSEALSNHLQELHEQYSSEDAPTSNNEASVSSGSSSNGIVIPLPLPNYVPSSEIEVDNAEDVACPSLPSTSNVVSTPPLEKMLDARAARLKRLEEQSQLLYKKVTQTTHRSEALSNRLEELHEQYGYEEATQAVGSDKSNNSLINSTSEQCQVPSSIPPFLEADILANESPPFSVSINSHAENHVLSCNSSDIRSPPPPPPPPLPSVFPLIRLPSEIGDITPSNQNLQRIQNNEDPT